MEYATARKHMVNSQVRPNDVPHLELQLAMENVARETFVPGTQQGMAYAEMDIELFPGRYLLQARDFSKLIHAARIKPTDVVLDVGCGYGYSSAILAHIAGMVIALEEDEEVAVAAEQKIAATGRDNVAVLTGPLADGVAKQGPYDAIVIANGAVDEVPAGLAAQLKDGGRLVSIQMSGGVGEAVLTTRSGDGFGSIQLFEAIPMGTVPAFARTPAFQF